MTPSTWCRLAGIDPDVVAMGTAIERRHLAWLARLYALPPLLCGLACAALGWVALRSAAASFLLGAAGLLSTWNVVRLLVASGGMPPHATDGEARAWRPGWNQLVALGLWVGLQMPVLAAWLLLCVGVLRTALEEWTIVQAQLGGEGGLAEPGLTGLMVVAGAHRELWLVTTVALCVLALLPCFFRRWRGSGFAAYARQLRRVQRTQIGNEYAAHRRALAELLRPFRRKRSEVLPAEWYADPPFCREPIPPNPAAFDRILGARDLPLPFDRAAD